MREVFTTWYFISGQRLVELTVTTLRAGTKKCHYDPSYHVGVIGVGVIGRRDCCGL